MRMQAFPGVGGRFPVDALEPGVQLDGPAIVYFYPRAGTETCTREAVEFNRHYNRFADAGVQVVGVSVDPEESVRAFAEEQGIRFPLLSDPQGELTARLGLMKTYGDYGEMAARTTFLLDREGTIRRVWNVEDVGAHVQEAFDAVEALRAEEEAA